MGMRRRNEQKRVLLKQEQEKEHRRIEEAIRRLDAIEQQRRKVQERKLDRERRRIAYAEHLERSAITLQRYERGRQCRAWIKRRSIAAEKLVKFVVRSMKRKALIRAIRNRIILRIATKVEATVEDCIHQACSTVSKIVEIQTLRKERAVRDIQQALRRRAAIRQRSADIMCQVARCWLARSALHRARMRRIKRRIILCCSGSLFQQTQDLPKLEPEASTTLDTVELSKQGRPTQQEGGLGKRNRTSILGPQETKGTDFNELIVQKHLLRERQFEAETKKRRLTVEKLLQLKEQTKVQQAEEEARQRVLQAEAYRRMNEEHERRRIKKLQGFRRRKLVKDLAEKKAEAAKREEEQRAQKEAEGRRRASAATFEREKARRLERERRKRRAEEEAKNAVSPTQGKTSGDRRLLPPLTTGNREEDIKTRKERGLRLRGAPVTNARDRERRRRLYKVPLPGARGLSLPMVPGPKTVDKGVGTEDFIRIRRRSTKGPAANPEVVAVVGGDGDHLPKGGEIELLPSSLKSGIGNAPRGSIGACRITGNTLTDSTEGNRLLLGVTSLQVTAPRGLTLYLDHKLAAEAEALTRGSNREGRRRSRPLAEYGVIVLETRDSAFSVAGPAAESSGDGGIETTSLPNSGEGNGGRHRNEPLVEYEVQTMGNLDSGFSVPGQAKESGDICGLGTTSPLEDSLSPGWGGSANVNTGDISRSRDNFLDLKENVWSYCGTATTTTAPGGGGGGGTGCRYPSRAAELEPHLAFPCIGASWDASRMGADSTSLFESGRWVSCSESTEEGVPRRADFVGDQQAEMKAEASGADFSLFVMSHLPPSGSREAEDAPGEGEGRKDTTVAARTRNGIITLGDDALTALDGGGLLPTLTRPRTINNNNNNHRSDNDSPPILLPRDFNEREPVLRVHDAIHPPRSSSPILGVIPTGLLEDVESGDATATTSARLARDTPRTQSGPEGAEEAVTLPPIGPASDEFFVIR